MPRGYPGRAVTTQRAQRPACSPASRAEIAAALAGAALAAAAPAVIAGADPRDATAAAVALGAGCSAGKRGEGQGGP